MHISKNIIFLLFVTTIKASSPSFDVTRFLQDYGSDISSAQAAQVLRESLEKTVRSKTPDIRKPYSISLNTLWNKYESDHEIRLLHDYNYNFKEDFASSAATSKPKADAVAVSKPLLTGMIILAKHLEKKIVEEARQQRTQGYVIAIDLLEHSYQEKMAELRAENQCLSAQNKELQAHAQVTKIDKEVQTDEQSQQDEWDLVDSNKD